MKERKVGRNMRRMMKKIEMFKLFLKNYNKNVNKDE